MQPLETLIKLALSTTKIVYIHAGIPYHCRNLDDYKGSTMQLDISTYRFFHLNLDAYELHEKIENI